MLHQLADFLDTLDDAGEKLVINAPGHRLDGMTLESVLNYGGNSREMQSDVRWLAGQLASLDGATSGGRTEGEDHG